MIKVIKKNAFIFILLVTLCLALPTVSAAGETRISVTIVYSGAIGGLFFLIAFSVRGFAPDAARDLLADQALVNYGLTGWRIGFPILKTVKLENEHSPQPFLEFLHLEF